MSFQSEIRKSHVQLAYLIDIDGQGLRKRYAERTFVIGGRRYDGVVRFLSAPGSSVDIYTKRADYRSITIQVSSSENLASLDQQYFIKWRQAVVTIRVWIVGQDLDCSRKYLYVIDELEGLDSGAANLRLTPIWDKWNNEIPDNSVRKKVWPDSGQDARHYPYSIIYGRPRKLKIPLIELSSRSAFLSGHHCNSLVSCSVDGSADGAAVLSNTTDSEGTDVCLVDTTKYDNEDKECVVTVEGLTGWDDADDYFGETTAFSDYRRPGPQLFHLIGHWGGLKTYIHWPALGMLKRQYSTWMMDWIVNREDPLFDIAARICDWMNVCLYLEDGYIKARRLELTNPYPLHRIVHGRNGLEFKAGKGDPDQIFNVIKFRYNYRHAKNKYTESILLNRDDHDFLVNSYYWYGRRKKRVECPDVYEDGTAYEVAQQWALLRHKERRPLTVVGDKSLHAVNMLDPIAVTHENLGLSESIYLVTGITADLPGPTMQLIEV